MALFIKQNMFQTIKIMNIIYSIFYKTYKTQKYFPDFLLYDFSFPIKEEDVLEPTVNSLVSSLSEVAISAKDPYLDFPFLKDPKTITYIKSSKTVFIMRGVSGSGKSTIARAIQKVYPSAVLCSADDYFMREGEYHFSADDLGSAHKYCQRLAEEAVRKDSNVIIIDNTNVKRWEMKFYMDLARQHLYRTVIVEPKLDWRNNPSLLASRNTHDVDENTIRKKIKAFEDYVPFYYAWFLNRTDSTMVYNKCCNTLRDCIKNVPGFCSFVLDKGNTQHIKKYNTISPL